MVHLPTVDCPVCGRTTKFGLPRDAEVVAVTADRPGDEADGLGRKCRAAACPGGHDFSVTFTRGADSVTALESREEGGAGDTEIGE